MNAGVETGGDEVDAALVARHVQHDVGVLRASCPSFGASTVVVARGETIKRTRPAGRSRSPEIKSTASRISPSAGRSRASNCAPAWVGATLRVVRASNRIPNRSSSARIAWLQRGGRHPQPLGRARKLRSSATARNAERTLSSSRTICERYSLTLVELFPLLPRRTARYDCAMDIKRAGSQPSSKGPPDWFTAPSASIRSSGARSGARRRQRHLRPGRVPRRGYASLGQDSDCGVRSRPVPERADRCGRCR